jgi:hypothetical protein
MDGFQRNMPEFFLLSFLGWFVSVLGTMYFSNHVLSFVSLNTGIIWWNLVDARAMREDFKGIPERYMQLPFVRWILAPLRWYYSRPWLGNYLRTAIVVLYVAAVGRQLYLWQLPDLYIGGWLLLAALAGWLYIGLRYVWPSTTTASKGLAACTIWRAIWIMPFVLIIGATLARAGVTPRMAYPHAPWGTLLMFLGFGSVFMSVLMQNNSNPPEELQVKEMINSNPYLALGHGVHVDGLGWAEVTGYEIKNSVFGKKTIRVHLRIRRGGLQIVIDPNDKRLIPPRLEEKKPLIKDVAPDKPRDRVHQKGSKGRGGHRRVDRFELHQVFRKFLDEGKQKGIELQTILERLADFYPALDIRRLENFINDTESLETTRLTLLKHALILSRVWLTKYPSGNSMLKRSS